ncbi:unnamed protein product [Macrosiphum euphorbiae]|uniref:Uncharacterized protein n=1 Tax=Macrosiphum euphorbiae TaxID=13131 RepID=A0AAV0XL48_9HEMI|nr:unnamed protein product [Macrosiphum euphorbiae]
MILSDILRATRECIRHAHTNDCAPLSRGQKSPPCGNWSLHTAVPRGFLFIGEMLMVPLPLSSSIVLKE